jgi:hypothetical protein
VTIIPPFRLLDSWGTNAILTPGKDGIKYYLETGRRSCWRHLAHIQWSMAIEVELARCIAAVVAGVPLSTAPHARRSPTAALPPSLASTAKAPSLASQRHLSIGASMVTDGDLDLEEDDISLSAWTPTVRHAEGRAHGNDSDVDASGASALNGGMDGGGGGDDDDDDLVVGEFRFVAQPPLRASLRRCCSLPRDPPSAAGGDAPAPAPAPAPSSTSAPGSVAASVLEQLLSPAGRRARQLSAAAGETLLKALATRLQWLEHENRKLAEQLSQYLGSVEHPALFDEARLRAALSDEFEGSDGDEEGDGGGRGGKQRVSLSRTTARREETVMPEQPLERAWADAGAIARQRCHST